MEVPKLIPNLGGGGGGVGNCTYTCTCIGTMHKDHYCTHIMPLCVFSRAHCMVVGVVKNRAYYGGNKFTNVYVFNLMSNSLYSLCGIVLSLMHPPNTRSRGLCYKLP